MLWRKWDKKVWHNEDIVYFRLSCYTLTQTRGYPSELLKLGTWFSTFRGQDYEKWRTITHCRSCMYSFLFGWPSLEEARPSKNSWLIEHLPFIRMTFFCLLPCAENVTSSMPCRVWIPACVTAIVQTNTRSLSLPGNAQKTERSVFCQVCLHIFGL